MELHQCPEYDQPLGSATTLFTLRSINLSGDRTATEQDYHARLG